MEIKTIDFDVKRDVPKRIGFTQPHKPNYREFSEPDVPKIIDLVFRSIDQEAEPEEYLNLEFTGFIHPGLWGQCVSVLKDCEQIKNLDYRRPGENFIRQFSR